jgi:hypothetical protein
VYVRKVINTTWVDCNGGKGPLPSGTNADEIAELVKIKLFENEREDRARALKKQDAAERLRAIVYEANQFEPDCWAVRPHFASHRGCMEREERGARREKREEGEEREEREERGARGARSGLHGKRRRDGKRSPK